MKINSLCFATLLATTASSGVLAGWPKWGSSGNNNDEKHVVATVINNDTIENIIHKEKRYVLYNSRRLTGECLPICYDPTPGPTNAPVATFPPISETITEPPVEISTVAPIPDPTAAPIPDPTGTPTKANNNGIVCEDLTQNNNLGYPFSSSMHDTALGATSHWEGCFPDVHSQGTGQSGFDDAIAVFIGGSYTGTSGAEIEGNMVVLGDFDVQSQGPLNVVSAGLGSQITPHPFGDCVKVGGTMSTAKRLEVYFLPPGVGSGVSYQCAMVSKGEASGRNHFPNYMTSVRGFDYKRDASMDMSVYEEQKENLIRKSEYWSTFPTTPHTGITVNENVFTFYCSAEDVIQVFNIGRANLHGSHGSYLFDQYCYGKTILINVRGTGDYTVDAKRMDWTDASGTEHVGGHGAGQPSYGFDSCMNSNILWNFFEAGTVSMVGTDEWQGSILVNGNFNFMTIGQSGRTMIVGDVVQNKGGSEFHNFQFNPPKPLPSPECDDFVPSNPTSPVPEPTSTTAPVSQDPTIVDPSEQTEFEPGAEFDPGNFCNNLAQVHDCDPNRRGVCNIVGFEDAPSCGVGVPTGYYPDLTRCDAYCWCTGTEAPSAYTIVNVGEYYDHKPQGRYYLDGQFGKMNGNGAYGTNGGIPVHINGGMSAEGITRPPGTCGPAQSCYEAGRRYYPWDGCTKYYQCNNGSPSQPQSCSPGTLWDSSINSCNHASLVDCEV